MITTYEELENTLREIMLEFPTPKMILKPHI